MSFRVHNISNNFHVDSVTFQRSSNIVTESQNFSKIFVENAHSNSMINLFLRGIKRLPMKTSREQRFNSTNLQFPRCVLVIGRIPLHPIYITSVAGEKRKLDSRGGNPIPLPGIQICSSTFLCLWPPFELDFPVLPPTPRINCYLQENVTSFSHCLIYVLEHIDITFIYHTVKNVKQSR